VVRRFSGGIGTEEGLLSSVSEINEQRVENLFRWLQEFRKIAS
jgi:hypothetical protein